MLPRAMDFEQLRENANFQPGKQCEHLPQKQGGKESCFDFHLVIQSLQKGGPGFREASWSWCTATSLEILISS